MRINDLKSGYRPLKTGEKIDIAFLFQAATVWPSVESLYKECINDERFSVKILLIEETCVDGAHMCGAREFLQKGNYEFEIFNENTFAEYIPHIAVLQFPYDAGFHIPITQSVHLKELGIRVVYIPYGIEIADTDSARKDHFENSVVDNSWRIYTGSEFLQKEYYKHCRNRKAVRGIGSPKFDSINNRNEFPLSKEISDKVKGRKLVVWKMHFSKKIKSGTNTFQVTPYIEEYLEFARKIECFKEIFFIIMPHPKMLEGMISSDVQGDEKLIELTGELFKIIKQNENTYIDTSLDYRNSMYSADAIIIDRSAVMVEAVMLGVPVLYMENKDYNEPLTQPIDFLMKSVEHGFCCNDMEIFLNSFISSGKINDTNRDSVINQVYPGNDWHSGLHIKNDLIESLRNERSKCVRVLLYGAGAICRYYIEQQSWLSNDDFNVIGIADSNPKMWGKNFYGYSVMNPSDIRNVDYDAIVIMTETYYYDILKDLVFDKKLDYRNIFRVSEFANMLLKS